MPAVLITGANRGIGLELSKQYAADGWTVHAACRTPATASDLQAIEGISIHQVDIADRASIDALAKAVDIPLDAVIANAGVMGEHGLSQSFGSLDYESWTHVLMVNTLGTVKTCEAFTPHLEQGEYKKMAAITSKMGSIADTSGGYTAYRTSKAALNMALTAAAHDLARKGIAVGVLHPGWVQTDMGGAQAPVSPADSATGLRKVIASLEPGPKAQFLGFDGSTIPW